MVTELYKRERERLLSSTHSPATPDTTTTRSPTSEARSASTPSPCRGAATEGGGCTPDSGLLPNLTGWRVLPGSLQNDGSGRNQHDWQLLIKVRDQILTV